MNSNSYFNAFILVFLAGLFWSFGAVTVRYMIDGHTYVFQYLFYRGISIAIILGALLSPIFYLVSPEWCILFGGVVAGTVAFFLGEKNVN